MERVVDARGLACPLPLIKARAALRDAPAPSILVVLATDPEAPIDLAALAADEALGFDAVRDEAGGYWRLVLSR